MHTHTYQYKLATPVPDSTPPEHRPNTNDAPLEPIEPIGPPVDVHAVKADIEALDTKLAELERKRNEQLASLRHATNDLVAIAYRESVARNLAEIRVARQRVREEQHGRCIDCHGAVTPERVESLPWATHCADCAR